MTRLACFALLLAAAAPPALAAGASNFTVVDGTGGGVAQLTIRRVGTNEWKPLAQRPGAVQFSDPDCAFDIQATVGGKPVTWTGINLCGATSVTLRRSEAAGAWVDYDQ